jgi:hypothetical protein
MSNNSVLTVANLLGVALGVAISIVLPVLRGYIQRDFVTIKGTLPPWVKKYGRLALFSVITALIILAIYESTDPKTKLTFLGAVLLGFGWEAAVEKFLRPPLGVDEQESVRPVRGTTRSIPDEAEAPR